MPLQNTTSSFGSVAKTFHWVVALLILAELPLGWIAERLPYETQAELTTKATLFSLHKTIGVAIFAVALLRILWALTQPRPHPLHPDRKWESALAEITHWLLYICLVAVPLSGWIHHAATEGFAPIWWPFGQSLPFVPASESVSHTASALHYVFSRLLIAALVLHVIGAIKHHVIDQDSTLRRMLPGAHVAAAPAAPSRHAGPAVAATAIFALVFAGGLSLARTGGETERALVATLEEVASDWTVDTGTLAIEVQQFGNTVRGTFADWTAAIAFEETPVDGRHGTVEVKVAIPSLTLGSVTDQAMGADFFNAEAFPEAVFRADILPAECEGQYVAEGTLTLKGNSQPLSLPFTLALDGDTAEMTGQASLDRLDFGIGETMPDESSLGHGVILDVALTAHRS